MWCSYKGRVLQNAHACKRGMGFILVVIRIQQQLLNILHQLHGDIGGSPVL